MDNNAAIAKLAASLDDDGVVALGQLLQKVAHDSARAGASGEANKEAELAKIAAELAETCELDEIDEAMRKIAAEKQKAAECDGVISDCVAMGTYIGKVAAATHIAELQAFAKQAEEAAVESEEDKKKREEAAAAAKKDEPSGEIPEQFRKKDEDEKKDEGEKKEAAVQRRIQLLQQLLSGAV